MTDNPYLLRRELDALQAHAVSQAQRGRNVAAVRAHLDMAKAHLAYWPRFLWSNPQTRQKRAHRAGYAALCSLNEARVGRPVGATIGLPTAARPEARRTTRCGLCGAYEALLIFRHDVFCETCFIDEAVALQRTTAYWSAPNDATYHAFDREAARRRARHDADRALRGNKETE